MRVSSWNNWNILHYNISYLSILFISFFFVSCNKEDFNWNLQKAPEIENIKLMSNGVDSFSISSNCISDGHDKNTEIGFCWSVLENPTIENNLIPSDHKGVGKFNTSINWTNASTIHIRAYAKNSIATIYSSDFELSWPGSSSNVPIIQTTSISNVSFYTLQGNATILSDGGLTIYEKGICISTSPNPNLTNATEIQYYTGTSNTYSIVFNGLQDSLTYFIVAFASSIAGTSYGNVISTSLPKHYNIGDIGPAGGYIIYQNPENYGSWNFLESAPFDIPGNSVWAPNSSQTNVTNVNISEGNNNTINLINIFGASQNYAASNAYNWNISASDWYLPSLLELKLIKEVLFDSGTGNLSNEVIYWSSSEDSNYPQNAWSVKMSNSSLNQITTQSKNSTFRIRAIRKI